MTLLPSLPVTLFFFFLPRIFPPFFYFYFILFYFIFFSLFLLFFFFFFPPPSFFFSFLLLLFFCLLKSSPVNSSSFHFRFFTIHYFRKFSPLIFYLRLNLYFFTLFISYSLDEANKSGLAHALSRIILNRQRQHNFQLVCITHDEVSHSFVCLFVDFVVLH